MSSSQPSEPEPASHAPPAATPPSSPVVRMRDIRKRFGPVEVLRGVDLEVYRGEVHVLAGENGAGKSTLINILSGVITDYEGAIEIDGQRVQARSPLHAAELGISVIHQELSLVPSMTVADNLLLARPKTTLGGFIASRRQRDAARALLARVGLTADDVDVDEPMGQLSIARQQMVEIAKALATDAKVLVMDEPTSALPATEVQRVFALIDRLTAQGVGIIYISHKMDEIDHLADRITVMRDGRRVGSAPAADLPHDQLIKLMVGRELDKQIHYEPPAQRGSVRLRVRDFTVRPAGGAVYPPVDGASIEVRGGEVLALAGLQGSGNSELLLGLFGAFGSRASGTVEVDGKPARFDTTRRAMASGLALLTNDRKETGLVLSLPVTANATLADLERLSPGGWRRPGRERAAAARHARAMNLRAAGLDVAAGRDVEVGRMSGGNQQKVALAKWLQREPKVLMLDEPTRGVDIGAKREIYGLINDLKRQGVAIVLISTEMPELLGLADRVAVMHRGHVTATFDRAAATPERVLEAAMGKRMPDANGGGSSEVAA